MSNCRDFEKIMQAVLDGTSSEGKKRSLEAHLHVCRDCAREFKALQLGLHLLVSVPIQEPSAGFTSDTVKMAFAAKKKQLRRQKMVSWGLSGLTAVISVLILAGWNMAIRPAIRGVLLNILSFILEWRILFKAFEKILAALVTYLITFGNDALRVIWEQCPHVFSGYLIALIIMALFILITGVKSSALSFRRR